MNLLSILLDGALLVCIMFALARHEADYSLPKALLLTVLLAVLGAFLSMAIGLLAIPIIFGVMIWALHQFFYLSWKKASIITVVYIAVKVALGMILRVLSN